LVTQTSARQIAETDLYGPILVDSECRSLYGVESDVDAEPTCVDECAEESPPLLLPGDEVPALADELDPSLFSVVEHADGPMLKVGDFPPRATPPGMASTLKVRVSAVCGSWWGPTVRR
jgi:hypothetical protein